MRSSFLYQEGLPILFSIFILRLCYQQNLKQNQVFHLFYLRFLVGLQSIFSKVYFQKRSKYFKKGNRTKFQFIDSYNFYLEFQVFLSVQLPVHLLPCCLFLSTHLYFLSRPDIQIQQQEWRFMPRVIFKDILLP